MPEGGKRGDSAGNARRLQLHLFCLVAAWVSGIRKDSRDKEKNLLLV